MAFVYRYVEAAKGDTKYVGMVRGDRMTDLRRRLREHSREERFKKRKWKIEFIDGITVTDAVILEAHFIAEYSDTLWNEAKQAMGPITLQLRSVPAWEPVPSFSEPWFTKSCQTENEKIAEAKQETKQEPALAQSPEAPSQTICPTFGVPIAPLMMSIRKAAGEVPLTENAIRTGVKQGWVPGFYVGKKFLVNVDRLLDMINNGTRTIRELGDRHMSDVTFTMDQIRWAAFLVLNDYGHLRPEEYARFTQGAVALVDKLSDLAGEEARETCLDKAGEARG